MPRNVNHADIEGLNQASEGKLPGHIGLKVIEIGDGLIVGRFSVRPDLVAHTGYLLAGAVLSVADICAPTASPRRGPRDPQGSRLQR